jgi:hypothetical protein
MSSEATSRVTLIRRRVPQLRKVKRKRVTAVVSNRLVVMPDFRPSMHIPK